MWPSVRAIFVPFTSKIEGALAFLYLDVKGLVTTGIGDLVDPMRVAAGLPFVHKADGSPATVGEIQAEWLYVKSRTDLAPHGGGAFAAITKLKLLPEGIAALVQGRVDANEHYLTQRFPAYPTWPADAQLGALSMAWALGPAFNYPRFVAAALAEDFATCAQECHISTDGNPGVAPRNVANVKLFLAAADVVSRGGDCSALNYEG